MWMDICQVWVIWGIKSQQEAVDTLQEQTRTCGTVNKIASLKEIENRKVFETNLDIDLQYKPSKMQVVTTVTEVNGKTAVKSSKWSIYILYKVQNYCSIMGSLKIYLHHLDSMLAEETVISYNSGQKENKHCRVLLEHSPFLSGYFFQERNILWNREERIDII